MALLDFDSFDYYQTANLGEVYDAVDNGGDFTATGSAQIVEGFGRCNTNCLKVTPTPAKSGVVRGVAAGDSKFVMGVAVNNTPSGSNPPVLFIIEQGTIPIFKLLRALDGSLVGLANPDAAFPPVAFISHGGLLQGNVWKHLGIEMVLAGGGAGSVIIAIDGVVVQTISGITTSTDGGTWTGVQLGGRQFTSGAITYYDDFYVMDGTGPAPWTSLLGDVHVQRLRPVSAGDFTQFTLTGAPTNWQAEDDDDHPDKSSYVESNVAGAIDSYNYEDLAVVTGNVIYGVKESALCYKDTAGGRTLEFLTRFGGSTYLTGTVLGIPTGVDNYAYIKTVMALDPRTGAQWANEAAVNNSQFGMELAS